METKWAGIKPKPLAYWLHTHPVIIQYLSWMNQMSYQLTWLFSKLSSMSDRNVVQVPVLQSALF